MDDKQCRSGIECETGSGESEKPTEEKQRQSGVESETGLGVAVSEAEKPKDKKPPLSEAERKARLKKSVLRYTVISVAIVVSGLLRALSVHCFVIPNEFAPGGVTGIATILQLKTGINSGIFMIAINLPLLIAAFFLIRKRFAIISTISIAIQSGLLMLFEQLNVPTYSDNALLAAVAGGVVGLYSCSTL